MLWNIGVTRRGKRAGLTNIIQESRNNMQSEDGDVLVVFTDNLFISKGVLAISKLFRD